MRHSPLIRTALLYARGPRSAQSGQAISTPDFPFNHPLRQQQWRASTVDNATANEHASDQQGQRRTGTPHTGPNPKSQTSTEIPLPARQQYDELACLVRIKPQPTSTIYTTAILKYFQQHLGSVLEFRHLDGGVGGSLKPPAPASGTLYRTGFANHSSLLKALDASPVTINVGSSANVDKDNGRDEEVGTSGEIAAPDASVHRSTNLDPYDVVALKDRHKPRPCTFTCTIRRVPRRAGRDTPSTPLRPSPTRQTLTRHKDTQVLYESLCASGLPADRAWVLALQPQDVPVQEAHTTESRKTNEAAKDERQKKVKTGGRAHDA